MLIIFLIGLFLGTILFSFTLIVAKKTGKAYIAPVVTLFVALFVIMYSIFKIGGFEGMGYGFLGATILLVAIIGFISLPFLPKKISNELNNVEKTLLVILPIMFFITIGALVYSNKSYWIIDQGQLEASGPSYYNVTTISEGSKQLHIQLGEEHAGKAIEVEKVKKLGNTEVILKITNRADDTKEPYIKLGLDEIVEPLQVRTTDNEIIHPK